MKGNTRAPRSNDDGAQAPTPRPGARPALSPVDDAAILDEAIQRILAQRAAQLAQVTHEEEIGEQVNLVLASMGREVFGLEAQYVAEIRPLEQITHVPRAPHWVRGVINWRGHVLSVLDLPTYWNLPRTEDTPSYLIICEATNMTAALAVDSVASVEAIPVSAIDETTYIAHGLPGETVRGIATRTDESHPMLTVLNLPAVLADPHLIVHEETV